MPPQPRAMLLPNSRRGVSMLLARNTEAHSTVSQHMQLCVPFPSKSSSADTWKCNSASRCAHIIQRQLLETTLHQSFSRHVLSFVQSADASTQHTFDTCNCTIGDHPAYIIVVWMPGCLSCLNLWRRHLQYNLWKELCFSRPDCSLEHTHPLSVSHKNHSQIQALMRSRSYQTTGCLSACLLC